MSELSLQISNGHGGGLLFGLSNILSLQSLVTGCTTSLTSKGMPTPALGSGAATDRLTIGSFYESMGDSKRNCLGVRDSSSLSFIQVNFEFLIIIIERTSYKLKANGKLGQGHEVELKVRSLSFTQRLLSRKSDHAGDFNKLLDPCQSHVFLSAMNSASAW